MKLIYALLLVLITPTAWANDRPEYAAHLIDTSLLSKAHTVIRQEQYEVDVKSYGELVKHHRMVFTIFHSKSSFKELNISYGPFREVVNIKAKLFDARGKLIRKLSKKEISDYSAAGTDIQDARVKHMNFHYGLLPYTVEVEYSVKYKSTHAYPYWTIQSYRTAVEKASFSIQVPAGMDIRHQVKNIELKAQIKEDKDGKRYRWEVAQLPAILPEAYGPVAAEVIPMVLIAPNIFELGKYRGDMSTWENYGAFYHRLNEDSDNLSKAMVQEVKTMTTGLTSNREKVAVLYRYLQEHMRYVSVQLDVGGWKSFDSRYVEKNKYGDCKALTYFMKAMLDKIGIEAYPTLIYASDLNYEVQEDFPIPFFNHVILYLPEEDIWMECTSNDLPLNYLGSFTDNRNALLVKEDGGRLIRTPIYQGLDNASHRQVRLQLMADGSAQISNSQQMRGPKHEVFRKYQSYLSAQEMRQRLIGQLDQLPSFTIEMLDLEVSEEQPVAELSYRLQVPRYASKAGKRLFVPLNCLNPFDEVPPADAQRQRAIVVRDAYLERDSFEIVLPEGYEVESMPNASVDLSTDYGQYRLQIEKTEEGLRCFRHLEFKAVELPTTAYSDFRDFYKTVAKMDKTKLVLVKR
ncbi:MAG: DUF3857 domain-containing protein [Bacteroidota bacterium]